MIVADTHLHIYDCYDLAAALHGCVSRLAALAPDAVCAGVMVERHGQHVYRSMLDGSLQLHDGPVIRAIGHNDCLRVQFPVLPPLYIFPGRQIVTRERLEILCLGVDAEIADGLPADEVVLRIRELDGVPVLAWAVGKWLFKRAPAVRRLLELFRPHELLLGDSAMRPIFWPEPTPMRLAGKQKRAIVAGTDPLPVASEIEVMGSYASLIDANLDESNPAESMRQALIHNAAGIQTAGHRCGPLLFLRRMLNSRT